MNEPTHEQAKLDGWRCKKCKAFYPSGVFAARCCARCECGAEKNKGYTHCISCGDLARQKRWLDKPAVEWDGKFPLSVWDDDKYFFDEDSLIYYVDEYNGDIETLQLTTCRPNNGRVFEMHEYLFDDLPEDGELDCKEIDRAVNDWIKRNAPYSWSATGERLDPIAVLQELNLLDRYNQGGA